MVYNGRPSTGCGRCKERRKKCDEARPGCLSCQKIGRPCPGYPDTLDLMFKNETAKVTRKAERKGKKKEERLSASERSPTLKANSSEGSPPVAAVEVNQAPKGTAKKMKEGQVAGRLEVAARKTSSSSESVSDLDWIDNWDPAASLTFNPSIERQATIFFFNNFVVRSRSKETTRGYLSLLPNLQSLTPAHSPLTLSTAAIAVRTAANFPRGRHLLPHAENLYGQALRAVNVSMQNPAAATSDETLLSILLFSLYESVTSSSVENWSKHVQGAVGIVKARGTKQFDDARGLMLFRATRTQMLTDAIQRRSAIEEFPGPNGWLSDRVDGKSTFLIEHSIRLPNVLAKGKELFALDQRTAENIDHIKDLLHEAYTLQHELSQWDLEMPPQLGYKSVAHNATLRDTEDEEVLKSDVWPAGPVHIYPDVQIAGLRNNNRVSQLLCSGVVIDAFKWLDPEGYAEDRRYKAAAYRVRYLVDDIAASVPFHLGYRAKREGSTAAPREETSAGAAGLNATGGYFLVWPLLIASSMAEVPALQRRWLKGKLEVIAKRFGLERTDVAQARAGGNWSGVVSDEVEKGGESENAS